MSNQGGLKHAATEPTRLDSKRERRRGAAGRASVLRRAPSDSDCSGETASLSADSGDRAPRPTPVARAGKTRGRRRGSEWEVLEGLKDGQRFDRKPEVFNGYLHKKRKWPLKGWHKRFFVIDAGILVYARSPTDVARGRLHGSVDVGLSVISAKARRRRIDIDADEFIYHLRAKTAEVFRTWLNVLKAHRLYRQHLLTFGARESAPKATLDDQPAVDGTSRTINTSPLPKEFYIGDYDNHEPGKYLQACKVKSKVFGNKHENPVNVSCLETNNKAAKESSDIKNHLSSTNFATHDNMDLVSLEIKKCQQKKYQRNRNREPDPRNESLLYNISLNSKINNISSTMFTSPQTKIGQVSVPSYFFKASKRKPEIRKSCKCTNLCKYKNVRCEPKLQPPLYRCALLSNIQSKFNEPMRRIFKDEEAQAKVENANKMVQDTLTAYEHDKVIQKLLVSFINNNENDANVNFDNNMVLCMNDKIRALYESSSHYIDPLKALFKGLLEFWLKNTSTESVHHEVARERYVDIPSYNRFTKDMHVSNKFLLTKSKETQYKYIPWNVISKHIPSKTRIANRQKCRRTTRRKLIEANDSTEKLESIVKNTIYICDTQHNIHRELSVTKKIANNMFFKQSPAKADSDSQSELDALNNTVTNLISDVSLPSIAREFFGAYLDIRVSEKSASESTSSSKDGCNSECNEHAEPLHRTSKCVTADNFTQCTEIKRPRDSYIKEIFGKVSSVFMKRKANKACLKMEVKKSVKDTKDNSTSIEDSILLEQTKEQTNENDGNSEFSSIDNWLPVFTGPDSLSDIFCDKIPVTDSIEPRNSKKHRNRKHNSRVAHKGMSLENSNFSNLRNNVMITKPENEIRLMSAILSRTRQFNRRVTNKKKSSSKTIDERFVLVLLEYLVLLSKNMPLFHEHIKEFYLKLRCISEEYKNYEQINSTTLKTNTNLKTQNNKKEILKKFDALKYRTATKSDCVRRNVIYKCNSENAKPVSNKFQAKRNDVTNNYWRTKDPNESNSNRHFREENCKIVTDVSLTDTRRQNNIKQNVKENLLNHISTFKHLYKVATKSQTENLLCALKNQNIEDSGIYCLMIKSPNDSKRLSKGYLENCASDDLKTLYRTTDESSYASGMVSPSVQLRGPQAGFVSGTPGGRLAGWIIESGGPLETASRELGQAQLSVQQLQRLLHALEMQQQTHHDTDVSLEGASPNVKKDRRKFGLRKKKSNSKCASVELAPSLTIDASNSHLALSALTAPPSPGGGASSVPNSAASLPIACAAARPQSLPGAESLPTAGGPASLTSLTPDHQLREDFTVLAKDLVASLKGIVATMERERGRLRAAMESSEATTSPGGAVVAALRTNLSSALQQNSELRTRLSRIHDASDLTEISSMVTNDPTTVLFQQSLSYSSSCVSASEFFDAEEHDEDKQDIIDADEAGVIELDGDSTSEAGSLSSEEGSASSDNSEVLSAEQLTLRPPRRARLPAPRPPGTPSLWNLLYKNIGKDLSQVSMPVTINEPLNMLQRLCEELEYSDLLDTAAATSDSVERMCLIAAFAVSAYSASGHRAASKPFNPLLGETYECVRDDRQFRFLAEQVSHHPPISACHAESPRWIFWQEARIKTKFWGKSMEFQPAGRVHVKLLTTGDHYSWNKVTTCVHNLFGGQRWVDQYGDMHIICHDTDISCKLNFIKASSWSSSRHEVRGTVSYGTGTVRVAGRWSEGLWAGDSGQTRCLYRPGPMPPDHELYYGFTRFAMELNELEDGMQDLLPHTDTRLRPDQRALELGEVDRAENLKLQLEQSQRERRRRSSEHTPQWFRKALEDGEETWVFTGEYWAAREAGFKLTLPPLW